MERVPYVEYETRHLIIDFPKLQLPRYDQDSSTVQYKNPAKKFKGEKKKAQNVVCKKSKKLKILLHLYVVSSVSRDELSTYLHKE